MISEEELMKKQKEEYQKMKKEYEEKLKTLEPATVNDIVVDSSIEQVNWVIYTPPNGEPKKYEIVTIKIPYEAYLQVTMEAWKEANGDKPMFSLLFQVHHMKKTFKKVAGMKVDAGFWTKVDPSFIDQLREDMYGPHDLYSQGDSELLKNLIQQLPSLLKSIGAGTDLPILNQIPSPEFPSTPP